MFFSSVRLNPNRTNYSLTFKQNQNNLNNLVERHEISEETYPPDCLAKSVRGNFKPSETGEGVGGYPVLGPDECDHLCTSIGGCKASFFHTVSTGDDLCYLVQSENPKGFTASPTGDGFLRSDFVCGNITGKIERINNRF